MTPRHFPSASHMCHSKTQNLSLSSPITIGDVELQNRNIMSALTRNRAFPDTIPNEVMAEHYKQRARSAGLIVTEGVLTSPQGTTWPYAPGIWSKEHVEGWKKTTNAVHSVGGKIFAQIWHVGRVAHNDMPEQKKAGFAVRGPSATAVRGYEGAFKRSGLDPSVGYSTPVALSDPTIIVDEFKKAAINAKEAGFDGVELQGANGYIITQFLDNTVNRRTDQWGGSVENRARLGLDIVKAVVNVFSPGRVGLKASPSGGYNDVGMPIKDTIKTFSYFFKQLVVMDIAYITLMQYQDSSAAVVDGKKRGTPHDLLAAYGKIIKSRKSKTKLLFNVDLTPDSAKSLISTGQIDAAVFATLWIANPDLQTRIEKELPLNLQPDFKTFAGWKGDDLGDGYTSYADAQ